MVVSVLTINATINGISLISVTTTTTTTTTTPTTTTTTTTTTTIYIIIVITIITPNLPTNMVGFRQFDSNIILIP